MAITFDTMQEAQAFTRAFVLDERQPRNPRLKRSMTRDIRGVIQTLLATRKPFTLNDVADRLPGYENRHSLITIAYKQMRTVFRHVKYTRKPSEGPRPMIVYNS